MIGKNNPYNIRFVSSVTWLGQVGSTRGFVDFDNLDHCFRAFWKIMYSYYTKHNIRTIEGVLNRWCPPNENPTEKLILRACSYVGVSRSYCLSPSDWFLLSLFMYKTESGNVPSSDVCSLIRTNFAKYFFNPLFN